MTPSSRTVDYLREAAPGKQGGAYLRVLQRPNGGSVVVMTLPILMGSDAEKAAAILDQELQGARQPRRNTHKKIKGTTSRLAIRGNWQSEKGASVESERRAGRYDTIQSRSGKAHVLQENPLSYPSFHRAITGGQFPVRYPRCDTRAWPMDGMNSLH